jgi:hypothetical protein
MAKITAKDGILLVGGYNFSTYAMDYEITDTVDPIEVTGLSDGVHNFIPGQRNASITANMLWDADTNKVHAGLGGLVQKNVTLFPEGYVLGNPSLSMPFMQGNYNPSGSPSTAITVGGIQFLSYGDNHGIERGYALAHGTITNTTTGTGFDDISGGAVTAACSGTLHVWTPTSTDTYVVKIQHSTTLGSGYTDLVTFTLNGTSRNSERITVASGTVNRYRRVLATRTGAAGDSFGFSVHFAHL